MKRTISAMVGQGSVNHNSRKFNAKNTDPERSHLNITYCHENIKTVFHELFEEALIKCVCGALRIFCHSFVAIS